MLQKTLYSYCDKHDKKCLSCDNRDLAENSKYCEQHAGYCLTCSARTAKKLYCEVHQKEEDLKRLVQQRVSLSNLQEVIRFNTWWNNNLATVINGNYSYTLWVLVYEPAVKSRSERLQKFEISNGYDRYSLASVKNKTSSIRNELNGENPILVIHPSANSYVSFSEIVKIPYVTAIEVPCEYEDKITMVPFPNRSTCRHAASSYVPVNIKEKIPNKNPENYLKPLDVIWVKKNSWGNEYYHVGVYLGSKKISHYSGEDKKQHGARIKVVDWDEFIKGCIDGEIFAYHPVIPFKNYELIAQQIDWADNNGFWEGRYCLANNNCEHRVNSFVYGINYSKQVQEKPSELSLIVNFYEGVGETVKWG